VAAWAPEEPEAEEEEEEELCKRVVSIERGFFFGNRCEIRVGALFVVVVVVVVVVFDSSASAPELLPFFSAPDLLPFFSAPDLLPFFSAPDLPPFLSSVGVFFVVGSHATWSLPCVIPTTCTQSMHDLWAVAG
jgi:hypothetical protein